MKRKIVFFVIIAIMLCGSVIKAQTWSDFLRGTSWQMQNPQPENWSVLWTFKSGSNFQNLIFDMNTNASRNVVGGYSLKENRLTVVCNNQTYVYSLVYINKNKIEARFNGGAIQLSRSKSSEDRWLATYLMYHQSNNGGGSYRSTGTSNVCYTCKGTGRCLVCKGSGTNHNSYTGGNSICSACNGTGKCWHCHGSGRQ